ncbi:leucyl/phenylalanyl-tRNA--protein transferase [Marinobacter salicampi]|uniref:leucyl/phenylalanyl-tRNA--protein transferase n=1 Tax=Marinobacter salicampi TaxID=435907 RepID=UPI00140CD48D|nr:leucyl/phenylalanyl-tRNA--protein transferase [Marinobacter salicampi]
MTSLPWLDPYELWFPPPEQSLDEPDGLLALGGDLSPDRLLLAYRSGIFPWFTDDQPILWWSPDPRCVLFPQDIHISRSLRRTLNKYPFTVSADQDFSGVINRCADLRSEGTWITRDMKDAYTRLHELGFAHSFEARNRAGELVGGLYGVALGRCFFGESMFSVETDASKVLMVYLANQLEAWGFHMMDCQVESRHLLTMGARTIPRAEFLSIIEKQVTEKPIQASWNFRWQWPGDRS